MPMPMPTPMPAADHPDSTRRSRSKWVVLALVVPIVATTAAGALGNAFLPSLSTRHPLLLIGLDARNRQLLLAAHRVAFVSFMVAAMLRKFASDPSYYGLGRRYGDAALEWLGRRNPRGAGMIGTVERLFQRAALPLVALWSGSVVCTLAGATRMNPVTFVSVDVVGSGLEVWGLWVVAAHFRGVLSDVLSYVGANQWWLTVLTVVLAAAGLAWQWRAGSAGIAVLSEIKTSEASEVD
jgi:membrane protein DedA with SNARE-associated domain